MVHSCMHTCIQNHQILRSVVCLPAVDVVHVPPRWDRPTELLLRYASMGELKLALLGLVRRIPILLAELHCRHSWGLR